MFVYIQTDQSTILFSLQTVLTSIKKDSIGKRKSSERVHSFVNNYKTSDDQKLRNFENICLFSQAFRFYGGEEPAI